MESSTPTVDPGLSNAQSYGFDGGGGDSGGFGGLGGGDGRIGIGGYATEHLGSWVPSLCAQPGHIPDILYPRFT